MDEKALKTLEFNKIKAFLREKCVSAAGKEKADMLVPSANISQIERLQDETTQAANMIVKKGSLPLGGIRDIREAVKRACVSGMLSIDELVGISDFLYVCRKIITYGKDDGKGSDAALLYDLFRQVIPLSELENEINRCVMPPDEVTDAASSELASIRRGINIANNRIREQLNSVIHSQTYKNMLQDSIVTTRSGRFCVPIKQEYVKSFPGMVHDQSSTGATVFMEPNSVVQLNNQIKELRGREKAEIERILRELSARAAEHSDELEANAEILAHLDFIFAKGELSLIYNGSRPVFNTDGFVEIRKARHPLLNKDSVVPIDIELGRGFTTLLITGPNTGGKTVALKTVGLFTLMGQAGLHIGAKEGSVLAVFDNVFADIGDEQSIEQSLSTFSSHMSNIVKILASVTPNSLCLLDELGAGTDPTEGAALAIAILTHLHNAKIRAAVTTHYSELKVYALSTQGVENASCEFDVSTLKPTYKLLIGIPGKSNAFEISRKLGLSEDIISSAKEILSKEDARFEDVITDLEISKKTALIEKERAESFRLQAENLKKEFETQKAKLDAEREKILSKAREEARQLYVAAKDEAGVMLREYKNKLKENKPHELTEMKRQISEKAAEFAEEPPAVKGDSYQQTGKTPNSGDMVVISGLNKKAVVTAPPDSTGQVQVLVGSMKMKVHISKLYEDISPAKSYNSLSRQPVGALSSGGETGAPKAFDIKREIDLRGCTVDEGLEKCDKYLDDAYLAGLSQVIIIHGKGTGVLRSAIQSYLKRHPHVKSSRPGTYGEGEAGVTVAELKT